MGSIKSSDFLAVDIDFSSLNDIRKFSLLSTHTLWKSVSAASNRYNVELENIINSLKIKDSERVDEIRNAAQKLINLEKSYNILPQDYNPPPYNASEQIEEHRSKMSVRFVILFNAYYLENNIISNVLFSLFELIRRLWKGLLLPLTPFRWKIFK